MYDCKTAVAFVLEKYTHEDCMELVSRDWQIGYWRRCHIFTCDSVYSRTVCQLFYSQLPHSEKGMFFFQTFNSALKHLVMLCLQWLALLFSLLAFWALCLRVFLYIRSGGQEASPSHASCLLHCSITSKIEQKTIIKVIILSKWQTMLFIICFIYFLSLYPTFPSLKVAPKWLHR